jgi:hypothetical protein
MEVIFWWMGLVWLVVIAAVVAIVVVRRRRRADDAAAPIPVAHSERLTELPGYRAALARYRALLFSLAAVLVIALVASIGLTMRFASITLVQQDEHNRDIVLCLDVSGSMIDYDTEVLDVFSELAEKFAGERLSLVIFNASAVTYFPLTSDVDYIQSQFTRLQEEFESPDLEYYDGTLVGNGSSLVGDGLASCAVRFDQPDQDRSRSVILVTDNLVAGEPIFSLEDAGDLASERGIRVYGVNPGDSTAKDYLDELAQEFEKVVLATGGSYYALDDPSAIPSIVTKITSQQAALNKGPVQLVHDDEPALAVWLIVLAMLGLFGLAWRLKR